MSSNEPNSALSSEHRRALLEVATASIEHGLTESRALAVNSEAHPEPLRAPRATFVTLRIGETLRGCMGSLQATEPLVMNVARNAFMAAFRDPRFAPLRRDEFPQLNVHLSLLGPPEPIPFESETDLLSRMRPGVDGLTLIEGTRRGTLLPSVWETIADPKEFLVHLKRKAGLAADYWSDTLRVERYTAESVTQEEDGAAHDAAGPALGEKPVLRDRDADQPET